MRLDGLPGIPAALQRAAGAVAPAIAAAAERTGVDFRALLDTARLESGFNPAARARTSSATGLFQFIDSTWLSMLQRHGAKHGIQAENRADALALRTNPHVAALMAGEFMAENGRVLEGALGRAVGAADLYLAHFLGAGGAVRFLKAMGAAPQTEAASLFPAAARANRSIFFAAGQPR
ncbi:MAG: transglycosylase SLT domain-containing protein, partial [Sphingomonadaceae bacterium]